MKYKTALLCLGILICAALTNKFGQTEDGKRPWLEAKNPTQLEWLALSKQATEGETHFGEDVMTINFYLKPESAQTGMIFCDIAFTHDVSAARLQFVEDSIQKRFEIDRKRYPWAHVQIIRQAAPF